jgi:glycosyltransferase involved in cell wall biosynthesis
MAERVCLFVNNSPEPGRGHLAKLGGGGKSLLSILKRIDDFGWRAQVVVPGEGPFTDALRDLGVPSRVFPYEGPDWRHPVRAWRNFVAWRCILAQTAPAIIHANGFEISRSFAFAARSMKVPFITHVRFPVEPTGIRWVLRGFPRPAAFVFNSHALRDRLWPSIAALAPSSKAFVVHNAVDLEEFTPAPWPDAPPYRVGIIANFAPFKRHEDFIRTAALVAAEGIDAEFWIVGDDTEGKGRRRVLEELAASLGQQQRVKFLGHRKDVPEVIRQLHVVVLTSQFEPFGRAVIEAMACGRPVVATRDGGVPEIIDEGETGFLAEVGDCAALARAIATLLRDREQWERLSRNAAEAARRRFSLEAHVARIAGIYDELLRGRTSAPGSSPREREISAASPR